MSCKLPATAVKTAIVLGGIFSYSSWLRRRSCLETLSVLLCRCFGDARVSKTQVLLDTKEGVTAASFRTIKVLALAAFSDALISQRVVAVF